MKRIHTPKYRQQLAARLQNADSLKEKLLRPKEQVANQAQDYIAVTNAVRPEPTTE